jgi:hypothetical protein
MNFTTVATAISNDSVDDVDALMSQGHELLPEDVMEASSCSMVMKLLKWGASLKYIAPVIVRLNMREILRWLAPDFYPEIMSDAIFLSNADMVEELIRKKCPFHQNILQACTIGNLRIVEVLLEHGADASYRSPQGMTPIQLAAMTDDFFIAKLLLDHGATPSVAYNTVSPLQVAVNNDNATMAMLLLRYGADVNHLDSTRTSALVTAVQNGDADIIDMLLLHGADTNVVNVDGVSALYFAVNTNNVALLTLLLRHGLDATRGNLLYLAFYLNHTEVALLMMSAGATLSCQYVDLAMQYAVAHSNVELCKRVIHRADVNAPFLERPLLLVALNQVNLELVVLLLRAGAVFHPAYVQDVSGYLDWAVRCYYDEYLYYMWRAMAHPRHAKVKDNDDLCETILGYLKYPASVGQFIEFVMQHG